MTAWDNTTRPKGKGPCFIDAGVAGRDSVSACLRARATARAGGLDKVRALQRVLYRSAKQQPNRRFHALYDKVARGDILWWAWDEVRSNRGAPGVDGVTIARVEASGVASLLQELAAALRPGPTGRRRCGGFTFPSRASRARPGRSAFLACATGWR